MTDWSKATEQEMRAADEPRMESLQDLTAFIGQLLERPHNYGTSAYAMSLAATAAFGLVARKLGCTGFQASCADMDFIRRSRRLRHGFAITDFSKVLYPQYVESREHWHTPDSILADPGCRKDLRDAAKRLLQESGNSASPAVVKRWCEVAMLPKLAGEPEDEPADGRQAVEKEAGR